MEVLPPAFKNTNIKGGCMKIRNFQELQVCPNSDLENFLSVRPLRQEFLT